MIISDIFNVIFEPFRKLRSTIFNIQQVPTTIKGQINRGVGCAAMRNSAPTRDTTPRARSRFGNTESETATSDWAMINASSPLPCAPSA